jgi:molecular chaperone DnaK
MNQRPVPAVGIDLGTTFSVVAVLDELGCPRTLINGEGDKLTPSAVLFDASETIVGKEAVKALATDATDVAHCAKRDLGQRMYHKILGGRQYPPEAIQAWVLNKLRLDAQHQIGAFEKVVITVPAYFDEVRRKATQDAGYMAGFDVLDIINEPTAAAIAFGYLHGFLSPGRDAGKRQRVLVYDLGGGTFDVTVMEISGRDFVALATDGDVQLGGHDWDQRLVDHVADEFLRRYGQDPRADPNAAGRLWRDCEEAKRTLSARSKAVVSCDYRAHSMQVEVTRETFHEITQDLLDRTAFTTRLTLSAAGFTWQDIDRILLVGGSTRMPAVLDMLRDLSGLEPDRSVSPDEAVAHGAALHASLLLEQSQGNSPAFRVQNVNSHSLGVVASDPATRRARNAILIPRNTPLPASAKRVFRTQKAGQKSILVQIIEGESSTPDECSQVGKCKVGSLPDNLPARTPIEVSFRYADNGRLTVLVNVAGSQVRHNIQRENTLSQEQLDKWRLFISGVPPKSRQVPVP